MKCPCQRRGRATISHIRAPASWEIVSLDGQINNGPAAAASYPVSYRKIKI